AQGAEMRQNHPQWPEEDRTRSLRAILAFIAMGIALAIFLAAIGHSEWFRLRPVSSAASAMSAAASLDKSA
ncbi:MAG: hypothetical protein VW935_04165, partial [Novosphingobium sp.]